MDILDRMLGHDEWTTRQLIELCRGLTPEQMRQDFRLGPGSLDKVWQHMLGNVYTWTDLMLERSIRERPVPPDMSVDDWLVYHAAGYAEFAAFARKARDEGRLDATYTDVLDKPPARKTFGGTITHVITHNMHHRCEAMHMLGRLGVANLIEGDALSWEQQAGKRPAS
jgi:uncharacterized damage-inducible protein DinB